MHNKDSIIKIASIGLLEIEKLKIKTFQLNSKNIKYLGESLSDIDESDAVIIKSQSAFAFQDIKFIYALFYKLLKHNNPLNLLDAAKNKTLDISKKIVRYKFFVDTDKKAKITLSSLDNYKMPLAEIEFETIYKAAISKLNYNNI